MIAAPGVLGAWGGPELPGTAYVLMHLSVGSSDEGGMVSTWGYPEGGMGAVYAGFDDALEYFRLHGGTGCNLTVPLKGRAFELAASCSPEAKEARAVNTLTINGQGRWHGDNSHGSDDSLIINYGF